MSKSEAGWAAVGGQPIRSDAERKLPDHMLRELDFARGGFDRYGRAISADQAAQIVAGFESMIANG